MSLENLNFPIAFAAGVISFLSPCILPIIPSFLSFLGGAAAGDLATAGTSRRAVFFKTFFFVVGFSMIFVALGALFSGGVPFLAGAQVIFYRIAGIVVVLFGLNVLFDFWKSLNIERRFHLRRRPKGAVGSVLLGLAFGAGWTPCVGPILASILVLAGTTAGTMARGMTLLVVYSIGLGAPFLLAGLFFNTFASYAERLRAHRRGIRIASGFFLIILGILIFFGSLGRLNAATFGLAASLDRWGQDTPTGPRLFFGLLFAAVSCLIAARYVRRVVKALQDVSHPLRTLVYPVQIALLLVFVVLTVLSLARVLDLPALISSWLRFQGI